MQPKIKIMSKIHTDFCDNIITSTIQSNIPRLSISNINFYILQNENIYMIL